MARRTRTLLPTRFAVPALQSIQPVVPAGSTGRVYLASNGGRTEEDHRGATVEVSRRADATLTLRVWDASPGTQVWLPGPGGTVVHLVITAEGTRLLEPVPAGTLAPHYTDTRKEPTP